MIKRGLYMISMVKLESRAQWEVQVQLIRLILLISLKLSLVRAWVASLVWTRVDFERADVILLSRVKIYVFQL